MLSFPFKVYVLGTYDNPCDFTTLNSKMNGKVLVLTGDYILGDPFSFNLKNNYSLSSLTCDFFFILQPGGTFVSEVSYNPSTTVFSFSTTDYSYLPN